MKQNSQSMASVYTIYFTTEQFAISLFPILGFTYRHLARPLRLRKRETWYRPWGRPS